jgi:transcription initiation factor TFIID subunit 10
LGFLRRSYVRFIDEMAADDTGRRQPTRKANANNLSQIPDAVTAHYLTLAGLPPPGTGPNQTPPHLARLLALATQKFVSDIAADSYQFARIRASNSSSANNPMGSLTAASGLGGPGGPAAPVAGDGGKGNKANTHLGIQRAGFGGGGSGGTGQGRTVLTMEDLGMAVSEYGVTVKRGEFYR